MLLVSRLCPETYDHAFHLFQHDIEFGFIRTTHHKISAVTIFPIKGITAQVYARVLVLDGSQIIGDGTFTQECTNTPGPDRISTS